MPAILAGVALAFARAVGEFGSLVLITGQPAVQDRGGLGVHLRPDRERRHRGRRRRLGVLLVISFVVLLGIGCRPRWGSRHDAE